MSPDFSNYPISLTIDLWTDICQEPAGEPDLYHEVVYADELWLDAYGAPEDHIEPILCSGLLKVHLKGIDNA